MEVALRELTKIEIFSVDFGNCKDVVVVSTVKVDKDFIKIIVALIHVVITQPAMACFNIIYLEKVEMSYYDQDFVDGKVTIDKPQAAKSVLIGTIKIIHLENEDVLFSIVNSEESYEANKGAVVVGILITVYNMTLACGEP